MNKCTISRRRFPGLSLVGVATPFASVSLLERRTVILTRKEYKDTVWNIGRRASVPASGMAANVFGNGTRMETARIFIEKYFQRHGYFPDGSYDLGQSSRYGFQVGVVDFSGVLPKHLCGGRRVIVVEDADPPVIRRNRRRM